MPKNFGLGVTARAARPGARTLVRLARRDLWQRLDRSMTSKSSARSVPGSDRPVR